MGINSLSLNTTPGLTLLRSLESTDGVTDRLVAAYSFGIHLGKHRLGGVHTIANDTLALAVVKTMHPANLLPESPAP